MKFGIPTNLVPLPYWNSPSLPEELEFKQEHGFEELVELYQEESTQEDPMVVNIHRENYCKE